MTNQGILDGVLVLDLAQLITGPLCASMLGDMGADVIKIEPPNWGEALRHIGPFVNGESVLFLSVNRNKRTLTLDLGKPGGREVLDRLIYKADVLIHNFRPDIRRLYGLDYERVIRVKPDIIQLSVSAFGEQGPYRFKPGTDHVFQGLSGLMSISGEPGQGPLRIGTPVADMTAALYSCLGVLGALFHRFNTGLGQEVKLNLLDAAMSLQQTTITEYLLTKQSRQPTGNSSPFACPVGMFKTSDGYVNIAAFNNKFWRSLCRTMDVEELLGDPRFKTPEKRMSNRSELEAILAGRFILNSTAWWLQALEREDVPCGPVHDYEALFADPQVKQNNLVRELPHEELGAVCTLGNPLAFGLTPPCEKNAAPKQGRHNDEILKDLGYNSQCISELREQGVI